MVAVRRVCARCGGLRGTGATGGWCFRCMGASSSPLAPKRTPSGGAIFVGVLFVAAVVFCGYNTARVYHWSLPALVATEQTATNAPQPNKASVQAPSNRAADVQGSTSSYGMRPDAAEMLGLSCPVAEAGRVPDYGSTYVAPDELIVQQLYAYHSTSRQQAVGEAFTLDNHTRVKVLTFGNDFLLPPVQNMLPDASRAVKVQVIEGQYAGRIGWTIGAALSCTAPLTSMASSSEMTGLSWALVLPWLIAGVVILALVKWQWCRLARTYYVARLFVYVLLRR